MTNRRAKIAAGATVLGLGALGGVALGTNPGMPPALQRGSSGATAAVVTSTSGAPAAQPVAVRSETRAPIVTRASGGLALAPTDE